jgi:hypothetical protein
MSYQEFLATVVKTLPKDHRLGQHYFNVLHEHRPEIASKLQATELNPFYNASVSPEAEALVRGLWGKES